MASDIDPTEMFLEQITRQGLVVKTFSYMVGGKLQHRGSVHRHKPTAKKVMNYELVCEAQGDTLEIVIHALRGKI